ncbi:mechanosensitive ion channel family protein [Selenihalanaerobacter shriftii]|uniref:Small conductance mechanosensitive channel n=1 Tax=Selenihalanaerobacter shriftii TaxID=142842 RepID=A0A1T4NMZ3_9FIRM|nr:mechanosensitive ion channel family protein [Selenihalanaerobacter shriftii]SJZ80573.1 small conductance mechanosensitive channel [Selenihalanaerobacter shriftii]
MTLEKVFNDLIQIVKQSVSPKNLILIGISILQLAGIMVLGNILKKLGYMLVDKVLKQSKGEWSGISDQRAKTLNSLVKSVIRYVIYFLGITMGLEVLGIPTSSILAGAGIVGLAVGFGARSLVQDIITGFFILFENQFGVGDHIETAGVSGIVEAIDLRITRIKSFDGDLYILPNSQIKMVTNYTADNSRVLVDVGIGYDEDVTEVISMLNDYCEKLAEDMTDIKEGPRVLGVEELAGSSVVLRILAWTPPLEKWQVARELKRRIKEKLEEEGIEIPYPKRVVITESNEQEEY